MYSQTIITDPAHWPNIRVIDNEFDSFQYNNDIVTNEHEVEFASMINVSVAKQDRHFKQNRF